MLVAWTLACTGTPPSPPPPAPAADPPRVERSGPVAAVHLAEVDRACRLRRITVGGDEAPIELGTLTGPCPQPVSLTWTADRLAVGTATGLQELGAGPIRSTPLPLLGATFDEAGVLHACGASDAKVTVGGIDADAEYRGRKLLGLRPRTAIGSVVAVPYTLGASGWDEGAAELVYTLPNDRVGAACERLGDFPRTAASSGGGRWSAADWSPALPADQLELSGLSAGDWFVDATRTLASRGRPDPGPYAAYYGGAWHRVHDGDALGSWVLPDHLAIRDPAGFRMISRRDGTEAFVEPADTLVFPWPEGAPVSGRAAEAP